MINFCMSMRRTAALLTSKRWLSAIPEGDSNSADVSWQDARTHSRRGVCESQCQLCYSVYNSTESS